jgi:ABC-2 type transport system permease protein
MVFQAFYQSSSAPQPMSLPQVADYIWLGQAMLAMFPWNVDAEIRDLVRTGRVAYEMLRPADVYWVWFCRAIAQRTAPTLLRAVPLLALALAFFGLRTPPDASAALWFLACLAGALLISSALSTILNITLLWTVAGDGIARLAPSLILIASGMIIPIPFFPEPIRWIIEALPFRGVSDLPFRIYSGHIPASQAWQVFAQQLAWTLVLVLLGRWLMSRGLKRMVVQGG